MTTADSQDPHFPSEPRERERLEAALAGRYVLERELGRGGMATVYLAHDVRHDRSVAIKVLHHDLAAALGPERFLREIRFAARLQHPHILTVLDSGEASERLWFAMPYVEGESLRGRLTRERQLPVDDAVRIAAEVSDALDYAHRHGVVHRDVKPENILLTESHALVADFGIAHGRMPDPVGEQLTATGLSVGTAAYMSPEQAAGERDLDGRSDVYSLACVLYEMLAGEPPFAAATTQATIARRFTEAPRPLRQLRESVPELVERAVHTALARTAADRFATAAEFARALTMRSGTSAAPGAPRERPRFLSAFGRRPTFAAMVLGFLLGLGGLFAWRFTSDRSSGVADGPPGIAVLPFENLGDTADAFFADGVTDAVRGNLTGLSGLRVIARGSSEPYRGGSESPAAIAAQLGVRYLLTGTVRWAKAAPGSSRVQVSPELVEVTHGAATSRWQRSFDAPLTDVFRVQGEIAGQVAEALRVELDTAQRARLAAVPTSNPAAYDAFLRAEAAYSLESGSPSAIRSALAYYERAVALDPTFAAAWARIAKGSSRLYATTIPTPELRRRGREAAERAAVLDPHGPQGHRALSFYYRLVERDARRGLAEAEAAYRLAPGDAEVISELSVALRTAGRFQEALQQALVAYALDPRSADRASVVALMYMYLRRPSEAKPPADRSLALAPADVGAAHRRATIALAEGDLQAARGIWRGATEASQEGVVAYAATYYDLVWALDDAGQRLALSLGPEAYYNDRAVWGSVRAQLLASRGDTARSRAWGDTAQRHFGAQLRGAPDDPLLHVLRGVALAYAGRYREAIAEGERGLALLPMGSDAHTGPYLLHQLARIHMIAGNHAIALDYLERLMAIPYFVTPAWLRIDPDFVPLRGNPRFERLAAGG